ncbi:MAG: hypothetical protein IJ024_01660 [Lachnospiraceae bacterium]|nr:hypothetical protein [Lachnospiraceae bacterium]
MYQYYKIAGLTVKMDTFGRTLSMAGPYRIDSYPEVDVIIKADWQSWQKKHPYMMKDPCEYLASGKEFYLSLIAFDGMMFHASAIAIDGKAYLFTADPGKGKSTHTGLWRRAFGDERVRVINDDKPAVRLEDGVWYAYGTPWSGKYGLNLNLRYPIGGICFLEQAKENKIEKYEKNDLFFQILKQTYQPADREGKKKLLSNIGSLLEKVPIWRLECNMELEAAILSHRAMTEYTEV